MEQDIRKTGTGMINISDIVVIDRIREDLREIDSLVFSIETYGQLEPIVVTDHGDGRFRLIFGERRLRAFKQLNRKQIQARLFESLDEVTRVAIELESDIRRSELQWFERAKGVAKIVELKRKQYAEHMPRRFGKQLTNKELASQLDLSISQLSEELKLAEALKDHPALEFKAQSRREALKIARDARFDIITEKGEKQKRVEENFSCCPPLQLLELIQSPIIDMAVLEECVEIEELWKSIILKLRPGASIILFTTLDRVGYWQNKGKIADLYTKTPTIWHVKGQDTYKTILWFGKYRENPIRLIPEHISCTMDKKALSLNAKPYALWSQLIKCCTEPGAFIVAPECFDIEILKVSIDMERNIRAGCRDQILRDTLILNTI